MASIKGTLKDRLRRLSAGRHGGRWRADIAHEPRSLKAARPAGSPARSRMRDFFSLHTAVNSRAAAPLDHVMFLNCLRPASYRAALCGAVMVLLSMPAIGVETQAMPQDALRRALPALRAAGPDVRRIFVEVAVALLSDRFLAAAGNSGDDAGWARATRGYVAQLWRSVDAVRAGAAVSLMEELDGGLRVVVAGPTVHQFALLPPRPEQRIALEGEVMTHLCRSIDCGRLDYALDASAAAATSATGAPIAARGVRTLSNVGDGLSCAAGNARHRRLRMRACSSLLVEVRALATALQDSERAGQRLDWSVLMAPLWHRRGAELLVAADGSRITVEAPLLARYPEILASVMPWIRARLTGTVREQAIALPSRLIYASTRSDISEQP